MKKTIIVSAPYMMTSVDRFRKVLEEHYGLEMIVPEVKQKLLEDDIIKYAGQFDGTICGDDVYSARVIEACSPRLKVVSKWGTGIDAIDKEAVAKYKTVLPIEKVAKIFIAEEQFRHQQIKRLNKDHKPGEGHQQMQEGNGRQHQRGNGQSSFRGNRGWNDGFEE